MSRNISDSADRPSSISKRHALLLGLGTIVCAFQTGCLSVGTHESLRDMIRPSEEFRQDFKFSSTNDVALQGLYLGEIQIGGETYLNYQFTNVLAGPNHRVLEVLIAQDSNHKSLVREAKQPAAGGEAAAFLLSHHVSDEYFSHPFAYFQTNYPSVNPEYYIGRSMYVSPDPPTIIYLVRKDSLTGEAFWDLRDADEELSWVIRSRAAYTLSHLRYLYSVPFDLVTSPLQIMAWVALAL